MIMQRTMAAALAICYFVVPLFPPFITLTAVTIPGVSLLPRTFAVALLALMALLAVYGLVMILRKPIDRAPTLVPLLLWLGAAALAALLGFNPLGGALFIAIFGLGVIWHLGLLRYYALPGVRGALFWSYMLSGTLASVAAIVMVLTRTPADQYAIGHGRAIGTFILPGELAGYLIIFLPIAFALARLSRDRALRAVSWCALLAGGAAMLLTFSRAGWVGLAAAIAFLACTSGRVPLRYAPLFIAGGLAAVLLVFNAHHNPAENYTRLSIWRAAAEIIRRFPLTGVGPFDFARIYTIVRLPDGDLEAFHAHDFLLTIFAEMGIAGVCAVLWTWWCFARAFYERVRVAPREQKLLALAVAAGLAGTWVQGVIDTVSVVIFGLWLPTMALALAAAQHGLNEEHAP